MTDEKTHPGPTVPELNRAIASVQSQMEQARSDAEYDRLKNRFENLDYELGLAKRRNEEEKQ